MNSFGHAVVAGWEREDPRFVLGAMLPDLGMLIGARLLPPEDEAVAAGVRHHHEVDDLFHGLAVFRDWWREAAAELVTVGLRRHSARAASHVAIELLLDGELAREPSDAPSFLAALREASEGPEPRWRLPPERSWDELVARLLAAGLPHQLRESEAVARRVTGALDRRARLRLADEEVSMLTAWLRGPRAGVGPRLNSLVGELRSALAG